MSNNLRLTLCSDLHLQGRTVRELQESERLLRLITDTAISFGSHVVCTGDFFHQKEVIDPPGPVVLLAHTELQRAWDLGCWWWIVMGNHDTDEPNNLGHSVLQLYRKVSVPILTPRSVVEKNNFLGFVPWAPPDPYRTGVNLITQQAMQFRGSGAKILFSHVSLKEGHVSPSNLKLNVPIRAQDLHPQEWTAIYLGDYHAAQQVSGYHNVFYLGAPRPQTFGDYDNIGIWLMEVNENGAINIQPYSIRQHFPDFRQYCVRTEADLPLPGYDSGNQNRIHVNLELRTRVRTLYPDAQIRPMPEEVVKQQDSRLGNIEANSLSPLAITDRWRLWRGLPEQPYMKEAQKFLTGGNHGQTQDSPVL